MSHGSFRCNLFMWIIICHMGHYDAIFFYVNNIHLCKCHHILFLSLSLMVWQILKSTFAVIPFLLCNLLFRLHLKWMKHLCFRNYKRWTYPYKLLPFIKYLCFHSYMYSPLISGIITSTSYKEKFLALNFFSFLLPVSCAMSH